jgi:hypothetical protein
MKPRQKGEEGQSHGGVRNTIPGRGGHSVPRLFGQKTEP